MRHRLIAFLALIVIVLALPGVVAAETPPVEEVTPDPSVVVVSPEPTDGETSAEPTEPVPSDPTETTPVVEPSLPPALPVTGTVRMPDGSAVVDALVVAVGVYAEGTTARTDEAGAFTLAVPVPPGSLLVVTAQGEMTQVGTADPGGCQYFTYPAGTVEIEIGDQGASGVEIVLDEVLEAGVCPETGGPEAPGSEGETPRATLPATDALVPRTAAPAATMPVLVVLLAGAALVLVAASRERRRR